MKRYNRLVLCIVAALLLSLSSCAPKQVSVTKGIESKATAQPTAASAGSGAGQPTATPKGQPTSASKGTAIPTSASTDEVSFAEVNALDKLSTYRLQFKWRYVTDKGEDSSVEVLNEVVRQPPASHEVTKYMSSKSKTPETPIEVVRIGNVTYTKVDDEWLAMQQGQNLGNPYAAMMSPNLYFGNEKGKYVGRETISGIDTKHYRYDAVTVNPMMKVSKLSEYKADVWVSDQFNVYVKATMHMVGVDEQGVKQTYDWESVLLDINKPLTIKPPEGVQAPGLPDDIPLMPGAELQTSMSTSDKATMTNLTIAKPVAEVIKFYTEQMVAKGWTLGESGMPSILSFTKGNREAQIIITESDGKTQIMISLTEGSGAGAAPTKPAATRAASSTAVATRPAGATPQPKTKPAASPTPSPMSGIPIMDGAEATDKGEDYLYYTVAKTLQEVNDFYQSKMTAGGWTLAEATEDNTSLTFTKDNRTAVIYLQEGEEIVAVNINVSVE